MAPMHRRRYSEDGILRDTIPVGSQISARTYFLLPPGSVSFRLVPWRFGEQGLRRNAIPIGSQSCSHIDSLLPSSSVSFRLVPNLTHDASRFSRCFPVVLAPTNPPYSYFLE